jgi:hypothetical protein
VTHADAGTGATMCGIIMKPSNGIQHSSSPEMRPLMCGKPPTKERSENTTTPITVTVAAHRNMNRNRLNWTPSSYVRTCFSLETYSLISLEL